MSQTDIFRPIGPSVHGLKFFSKMNRILSFFEELGLNHIGSNFFFQFNDFYLNQIFTKMTGFYDQNSIAFNSRKKVVSSLKPYISVWIAWDDFAKKRTKKIIEAFRKMWSEKLIKSVASTKMSRIWLFDFFIFEAF